jgi:hypothetical protein
MEVSIAAAEAVALADVDVIAAYPITPQTHIVEHLAELVASGHLDAEFVPVESEHSAMSTCVGSSAAGARTFYGAQSRVMDGTLARANCLLITTLWSIFKFVLVPIGVRLGAIFPPPTYATLFILIWGAYTAADASSEIVGSLFGKQKLRVWGMGDVNRKSLAGLFGGFFAALALCLWAVLANGLPLPWVGLAVVIAVSSALLELYSPRGTDDFTMATGNALLCWGFGVLLY